MARLGWLAQLSQSRVARGGGRRGQARELQAAARFAQRPGCSRNHLHLRGGERGAVAAVALAGEHRGGAYLRCTRLQAGRTGLQAVCTGPQAFVRSASLPVPVPLTLTLLPVSLPLTLNLTPDPDTSPYARTATHPQEAVEEEVAQVAAAPAAARLHVTKTSADGLCGTWLQPLLRTSGDAARLGAEHRRLHWP